MPVSANSVMNPAGFKKSAKQKPPAQKNEPAESRIPLASIRVDGGTQHRPLDEETVQHYADRMMDKSVFPPVEVVWDGTDYWLWDGFHRVAAARIAAPQLKISLEIRVKITAGTLQDAQWLSFSANRDHGMPRTVGVVKGIMEAIFRNPLWNERTITDIARHVGVSTRYARAVHTSLEGGHDEDEPLDGDSIIGTSSYDAPPETALVAQKTRIASDPDAQNGPSQKDANGEIIHKAKMVTRKGKTFPQKAHRPRKKDLPQPGEVRRSTQDVPRTALTDEDGIPIPDDLSDVFRHGAVLDRLEVAIVLVKQELADDSAANPEGWSGVELPALRAALTRCTSLIAHGKPTLICPTCGGVSSEKCLMCKGRRWLSWFQAKCVAVDLRNIHRKQNGLQEL
jgi:hypothetical protein